MGGSLPIDAQIEQPLSIDFAECPWLELVHTSDLPRSHLPQRYVLHKHITRIGRDKRCDLCVSQAIEVMGDRAPKDNLGVSLFARVHALVKVDLDQHGHPAVSVFDNKSKYRVWILSVEGLRRAPCPTEPAAQKHGLMRHGDKLLIAVRAPAAVSPHSNPLRLVHGRPAPPHPPTALVQRNWCNGGIDEPYQLIYELEYPTPPPASPLPPIPPHGPRPANPGPTTLAEDHFYTHLRVGAAPKPRAKTPNEKKSYRQRTPVGMGRYGRYGNIVNEMSAEPYLPGIPAHKR